jgi:phosphoribosylaminoimidazolecarboxamide formyltransferase/IMP cyclohydrolase
MFKNALVSVSNKNGLIEFLRPYVAQGMRVVSTGGTLRFLRENSIAAVEVSEQTGFPEVMDGRVKTLHPRVHMALLARAGNHEDQAILDRENLAPFDLVVVNLYPFRDALERGVKDDELIEFIDIGGPSLLRAAAKNHKRCTVVCEPSDYEWVRTHAATPDWSEIHRRELAGRVFKHTSRYDDLIAKTLCSPETAPKSLVGESVSELRYGENPHSKAWWFRRDDEFEGLHQAEILHGKPLSYNNILDLDAAVETARLFDTCVAVAVKHNNPCGVGESAQVDEAVERCLTSDPISVFGGIVATNRGVDRASAEKLSKIFLECVIAPAFSDEALEILKKKKDLRLLRWPNMIQPSHDSLQFHSVRGGYLVQTEDRVQSWSPQWTIIGEMPSQAIQRDLLFAWRVCARLKSNAIAIAAEGRTMGLGMGQVNRVEAVEHAISRMQKHHSSAAPGVLASDAFFPFADSIERIANAGIRWIIQPGGSVRDQEVIDAAKARGVGMVMTSQRHFRH